MEEIEISGSGLRLHSVPDLCAPSGGEVQIRVASAGVNRADLLQKQGKYPPPPGAPETLGLEVSGVVVATGPDQSEWHVGDHVMALLSGGGYAQYVNVDAGLVMPVPRGVDLIDAGGLPEALVTAYTNLVLEARLSAGEVALIFGASGGVGSVGVQIAKAVGATVLATAGSQERAAQVRELGADAVCNYRDLTDERALGEWVMRETRGHGADVVLDVLAGSALDSTLRALATRGRIAIIGTQAGSVGSFSVMRLMGRRATIMGTTLRSRPLEERRALMEKVRTHVLPMVERGDVHPVIRLKMPLFEAERAHEALEAGEVFGKAVLIVEEEH